MVQKYVFGSPFETEAVTAGPAAVEYTGQAVCGDIPVDISLENGFACSCQLADTDIVYGLGEANRGINKRGYRYVSNCTDDPHHTEEKVSLYGAHNFVIISGKKHVGLFFDYPSTISFDIGYTRQDLLTVCCERADLYLYVITGESARDVARQFRRIIGKSYIAPRYAFGFGQSRWGYKTAADIEGVVEGYRENGIPLDMVYMDIDYMQDYKDFTVNPERFPDFGEFVQKMKAEKIHLIPIIDAGVKIEQGYDIYEEGVEKGYFCKREDGSDFVAAVWPGWTHFPDVLNPEARAWFGGKYQILTDLGIDGFWNDMNEPAVFYSEEGIRALNQAIDDHLKAFSDAGGAKDLLNNASAVPYEARAILEKIQNNEEDYRRFYHKVDGKMIRHDLVHNLFGFNMTRAAGEALQKIAPEKKMLLFSRSSYIGMHRYGGIWTGDNQSWWSHILLNLKMMPSLNMCGFLYAGADLGGFGSDTTRDLLLRWLALGVFTPLMRNHTAIGTREQECYRFGQIEDFRHVIGVRYRLIPYLYSEYLKAVENDEMYFRPLGFDYPDDRRAVETEDQLMLGDEVMIAPVYTQNVSGRTVYLPEEMKFVKFMPDGSLHEEILSQGTHYVEVALNEVPLFIRKDRCIPVMDAAQNVDAIDMGTVRYVGYDGAVYEIVE
ncbi:MAG: alpha-glucosidase [Lachnospiraceae bacterium]|jgi:alpha-glucosidase|nr:alpha-glucosidase [Lachnospiraceae bacterium]